MNSLEKDTQINELYDLHHFNDNFSNIPNNFRYNILKNSLSKQLFKNDINNEFLLYLQKIIVTLLDSSIIIRNWFNFNVSKYYDKHIN
jgi:hypothetical protein